jgi:hypothetical protein
MSLPNNKPMPPKSKSKNATQNIQQPSKALKNQKATPMNCKPNANSTSEQPENKALDRFVSGFTKSGYSKEQAISAYNTYAALANQQGVRA